MLPPRPVRGGPGGRDPASVRSPRTLLAVTLATLLAAVAAWVVAGGGAGAAPGDPPPTAAELRVAYAGTQHRSIGVAGLGETATSPLFTTGPQHFDDEASARGGTVAFVSRRESRLAQVYVRTGTGAPRRIVTPADQVASHPVVSYDGTRVAFALTREGVAGRRDIWVADVDGGGTPERVTDGTGDNYWPTWSRDGREIAFEAVRGTDVPRVWCVVVGDPGSAGVLIDGGEAGAGEPAWNTADGRTGTIAYTAAPRSTGDRKVHLFDRGTGTDRLMLNASWESRQPSWSADGDTVAFLSRSVQPDGGVAPDGIDRVYTAQPRDDGCACVAVLHSAEDRLPSHPGWYYPSPGDERLLISRTTAPDRYTATLQDIRPDAVDPRDLGVTLLREDPGAGADPDLLWNPRDGDPWWSRPSYSPDGQQILVSRFEGEGGARVARLWVVGADGSGPRRLRVAGRTPTSQETEAVWSPDGTSIAYAHRDADRPAQIRVIDAGTGEQRYALDAPATGAGDSEPAWSPDSTELAYTRGQSHGAQADSHVWVAAAAPPGGPPPRNISEASGCQCRNDYSAAFSPDGEALAFGRSPDGMLVTDLRGANCRVLVPAGRACTEDLAAVSGGPHRPAELDWSPDATRLAHVSRRDAPAASPEYVKTFALDSGVRDGLTWELPGRHKWPAWQRAVDVATEVVRAPGPVPAGGTATVQLSVTDKGPTPAFGVHVDLTVPPGVELTGLDADDDSVRCDVTQQSCTLGRPGVGTTRVIRARLTAPEPVAGPLRWTAGGWLADAVPGDNTAEVPLVFEAGPASPPPSSTPPTSAPPTTAPPTNPPPVTAPDVRISLVINPTPTWVGRRTTVTYTVRNVGDGGATDVAIRPRLPGGIPVVSRPAACAGATCAIGDLPPGAVRTLVFVLVPDERLTGTVRGRLTADDLPSREVTGRLRVLQPRIEAIPAMGPPGFVTIIRGRDFPPGVRVRLSWDVGVTVAANPAVPGRDGRFDAQLPVLPEDALGPRTVLGTGSGFARVSADFRVILPAQQPPGLVLRK
ncbi:hypothetical protein Asp14428_75090 [Actinoplanes sp. NBRC 14428]|nr:hypothetical protein Asp14428_75090 [Actinoplanes sp. NBRC 14428]